MIGIIGAMQEEIDAIKQYITIDKIEKIAHTTFYLGTFKDKKVVLLLSGIGKVSSAVATSIMFQHYDISYVINLGTAGGLKEECNVGDIVVSNGVVYHDVDVLKFGYEYGQVPDMPKVYKPDDTLFNIVLDVLSNQDLTYHIGLIASGDSFVTEFELMKDREQLLKEPITAIEMEAASIAQTCYIYEKPFIIIRSLSDIVGSENQEINFETYLEIASENSSLLVKKVLEKL